MFLEANKATWMAYLEEAKSMYKKIFMQKQIYCTNTSTLLMQYIFFYIKKFVTCVVLGDKYIDGDFGCGSVGIKSIDIQWIHHSAINLMCWRNLQSSLR